MDAKKLLKKHLALHIPKNVYLSDRELAQKHYDASIDAINEALSLNAWVDINVEKPKVGGKYIVRTKTTMENTHRLEANYTVNIDANGKDKSHFNVSNQIVTHWLKETE